MNKYGVCNYELNGYNPKVENLEIFNTYGEAYNRYMALLQVADKSNLFKNNDLWLIYIDEYNRIVQFEQLDWKIKCKLVELNNEKENNS